MPLRRRSEPVLPKRADAIAAVSEALRVGADLHAGWDRDAEKYGFRHTTTGRWLIHSDEDMDKTDWTALRAELILQAIERAPRPGAQAAIEADTRALRDCCCSVGVISCECPEHGA